MTNTRVLLVEPYYGGSHRAWADGWVANSRHQVGLITHTDQFWRWRMRGGAVTLAAEIERYVAKSGPPDLLMTSDMVDIASLVGLARRSLGATPVVAYFHENQVVHPLGPGQSFDEGLALTNWRSMVAADQVWFNSQFHLDLVFEGLAFVLGRPNDFGHEGLIADVRAKCVVQPVGVNVGVLISSNRIPTRRPLVLWNQRWDHDKNPKELFAALVELANDGVVFDLALAGENTRVDPQEFARIQEHLGERVVHVGEASKERYQELLLSATVVASTTQHEFFGISMVEAMAAGCIAVLPNRLSYPEIVPEEFHGAVLYEPGGLGEVLRRALTKPDKVRASTDGLRPAMGKYDWSVVGPAYDQAVDDLVAN